MASQPQNSIVQYNGGGIQIYRYVYTVRNMQMTIANQTYTFEDGTCVYCIIRHDFIHRRFPIIQIGIEMDSDLIETYFQNKENVKLKIDIYEQQLDENDQIMNTTLYLRYTFDCISARDQTAYITTPDYVSQQAVDEMRRLQLMELYLIDMEMVNTFAREIAEILEDCSKASALQLCFMDREVQPGVVIATPPQYERTIDYVSVPLGDLVANINTLNEKYGLYDGTPIIYYDYKNIYCLNSLTPDIKIKSTTEFGNVTFLLLDQSNQEHNIVGSTTLADQKTHLINLQNEPEIYDTSERSSSTKFATLLTVESNGTVNQRTMDPNTTKVHFIRQQNELTQDQYVNDVMTGHVLSINTNSCCVSFLKPYKAYYFQVGPQYTDKGLTGHEYRLTELIIDIQRDKPDKYKHSVRIRLQKPYEDPTKQ